MLDLLPHKDTLQNEIINFKSWLNRLDFEEITVFSEPDSKQLNDYFKSVNERAQELWKDTRRAGDDFN